MTFALDAETHRRLVPPRGAARDRRHPGRPRDLRLPHRPRRQGRVRPDPRRHDHAERRLHVVDDPPAFGHQVPRRHRRSTRRSSKNNLDAYRGKLPGPHRRCCSSSCSTNIKARHASTDPMTVKVDMKTPWAAFPAHLYEYGRLGIMARGAARRRQELLQGHDRHRSVQVAGDWVPNDHLTVGEEPELLAQGRGRPAAAVPRQDHVQAGRPTARRCSNGLQVARVRPRAHRRHDHGDPELLPDVKSGSIDLRGRGEQPRGRVHDLQHGEARRSTTSSPARRARTRSTATLYNKLRQQRPATRWRSGPFGPGVLGYLRRHRPARRTTSTKAKALVAAVQDGDRQGPRRSRSRIPNDAGVAVERRGRAAA